MFRSMSLDLCFSLVEQSGDVYSISCEIPYLSFFAEKMVLLRDKTESRDTLLDSPTEGAKVLNYIVLYIILLSHLSIATEEANSLAELSFELIVGGVVWCDLKHSEK